MPFDIEVRRATDFLVDFREEAFLEIDDLAACSADQVVMRRGFCLVAIEGAAGIDFPHEALLYQDGKISVDGSEAEAGELLFQPVVEPCRRWMGFRRAQDRQQPFALPAVSIGFFRNVLHGPGRVVFALGINVLKVQAKLNGTRAGGTNSIRDSLNKNVLGGKPKTLFHFPVESIWRRGDGCLHYGPAEESGGFREEAECFLRGTAREKPSEVDDEGHGRER